MGSDLGTYHLRVELLDGRGWIQKWETGRSFSRGTEDEQPLDAQIIAPAWEGEEELFETMVYIYEEGNYSCDCNKRLFLANAYQQDEPEENPCGDTMPLLRLTAIRPDGKERLLLGLEGCGGR